MANTTDGILEYGMTDLGRLNSIVDYVDGDIMIVSNAASVSTSQPTRGNMFTLMACAQGRLHISLNGESYDLKQGDLLFCLPNVIIGGVEVSDDFKGSVLCMTSRIVQGLLGAPDMLSSQRCRCGGGGQLWRPVATEDGGTE